MSEHTEQVRLITCARQWEAKYPELALLHAIPNGGKRHRGTAAKLKAEGVKAGVPDLCLPVARGGYHGMYLEMKYGKNKPTPSQAEWLEALRGQEGYHAVVCHGFFLAKAAILEYLEGEAIT